ncbi:AAA family ATPase [Pseudomonas protegens]|uniref:AAA family ATPase n=1 Tax=Pseudomonas protegens TaxID=380021 RepID=UPI000F4B6B7D|nr:AAA family ATPase [Pseudomonas protegens]
MKQRIYLIGASGSGVSTLGAALARHLQLPRVDVDEHYWYPSDPPFLQARPVEQRLVRLHAALGEQPWVVSGSMDGWGDAIIAKADWVLYLDTPTELRLQRIATRERQRFGSRILPGGDMHHQHLAFLEWAAAYDSGARAGRSRPRHEAWLAQLKLPWGRLDGRCSEHELLNQALLIMGRDKQR